MIVLPMAPAVVEKQHLPLLPTSSLSRDLNVEAFNTVIFVHRHA